jgi:hypothetical protein
VLYVSALTLLFLLGPPVCAQTASGNSATPSTAFQAYLTLGRMISLPDHLPFVSITVLNPSNKPISFQLSAIKLFVTRSGTVVHPDNTQPLDPPNCGQPIHLQPNRSMDVLCGHRVSTDSYDVGAPLSISWLGYDLQTPGHYTIYARIFLAPIPPATPEAAPKQAFYVQTPAAAFDVPYGMTPPAGYARTGPNASTPSTILQAHLVLWKMISQSKSEPIINVTIRNPAQNPISLQLSSIQLFVARNGIVVHPDNKQHLDAPHCRQPIQLQPSQSMDVFCGYDVSDVSYVVNKALRVRSLGYDLQTPGHYTIYARVFLTPLSPVTSEVIPKKESYLQTPAVALDVP